MGTSLADVLPLVDQLTPADQARLIQFLVPRVTAAVIDRQPPLTDAEGSAQWQRFRTVGDRLAASAVPGESITDAVSQMRR